MRLKSIKCNECGKIGKNTQKNKSFFVRTRYWFCKSCYKRLKGDALQEWEPIKLYYEHKQCSHCNGKLELSRYNICSICRPDNLKEDDNIYYGMEVESFNWSEMELLAGGAI